MKTKNELRKELEKLRKLLKLLYPEYHYKHLDIFTAYWKLREEITQN